MANGITYTMDFSVPCNYTNTEYRDLIHAEWKTLLDSPSTDEKAIQQFLELHPSLLPFTEIPFNHGDGHALSKAVITQPELPGLKTKVPDFLYFTGNSGEITAVMIEIECPKKKWFTKAGNQDAKLTQAVNQIKSWKTWFKDPTNVSVFERDYLVRNYNALNDRVFKQQYILVIGRRSDITDPSLNRMRSSLSGDSETWMTYDRLQFSIHSQDAVTVKLDRSGPTHQFKALHVSPLLKLGPFHYPAYHELSGLEDAIKSNNLMSLPRRQFLLKRLSYWNKWYSSCGGAFQASGADLDGE